MRRAGGGTTAPVLVCGERVLAESAEILEWADAQAPAERRIYPDDPDADRAEIRRLERDFDRRLGPEGRRWMYNELRGCREIALAYATTGVPAWERRVMPLLYPWSGGGSTATSTSPRIPRPAPRSWCGRASTRWPGCSPTGVPSYAVRRFSAADLTFSALAASVLMPPQYGVPLPQPGELPEHTAADGA